MISLHSAGWFEDDKRFRKNIILDIFPKAVYPQTPDDIVALINGISILCIQLLRDMSRTKPSQWCKKHRKPIE
jgi:hypothetical protein